MPEQPGAPQNAIPVNAIPATAQAANAPVDPTPADPAPAEEPGAEEQPDDKKIKKQKSKKGPKMKDGEVFVRDRRETTEEEMIYESKEKGCLYMNLFRFLWCGCCEPYQRITTKYVEETSWKSCGQATESIAFENVMDVAREQSCLCSCFSFLPCCCCIEDMADIVLYGTDASEKQQHGEEQNKMVLERVAHSFRVFETLTAHLQRTHKLWRKQGRVYKRKVEQVECFAN